MRTWLVGIVAMVILGVVVDRTNANPLIVGDPAPKLLVGEFVKGEPVKEFTQGTVYVVEFTATWCGPCREAIPHLTALQKKYPKVVIVSVSVWEQDSARVRPFVEKLGEKIGYRVATDNLGDMKGDDGFMATNWLEAARQNGIPSAFIVDSTGTIAWIGDPRSMEETLTAVVEGRWDIKKAAAKYKRALKGDPALLAYREAELRRMEPEESRKRRFYYQLEDAREKGDDKELLKVIDAGLKTSPLLEKNVARLKFRTLARIGEVNSLVAYGNRLVSDVFRDDVDHLNEVAWILVGKDKGRPDRQLVEVGLKAVKRADELASGKNASVADTLAKALYESGDSAGALKAQERAMKLAKGTLLEKSESMNQRLKTYRKAVGQ